MARVKEISVFVDESGSFAPLEADPISPYYLLCMVFHNQEDDISVEAKRLSDALQTIGLFDIHDPAGEVLADIEDATAAEVCEFHLFRIFLTYLV